MENARKSAELCMQNSPSNDQYRQPVDPLDVRENWCRTDFTHVEYTFSGLKKGIQERDYGEICAYFCCLVTCLPLHCACCSPCIIGQCCLYWSSLVAGGTNNCINNCRVNPSIREKREEKEPVEFRDYSSRGPGTQRMR